jgi:hypothetical protein
MMMPFDHTLVQQHCCRYDGSPASSLVLEGMIELEPFRLSRSDLLPPFREEIPLLVLLDNLHISIR